MDTQTTSYVTGGLTYPVAPAPAPMAVQGLSPGSLGAPIVLLEGNESEALSSDTPTLLIDDPSASVDPDAVVLSLQAWAYSFEADVLKATSNQLKIANLEAKLNLQESLKKLSESIKKMKQAKRAEAKRRSLGFFGMIIGAILSIVAVVFAVTTMVATGGATAPLVALAITASLSAVSSLINMGAEIHAQIHGGKAFSLDDELGAGWAGLISCDFAKTLVELAKWSAEQDGKTLSPEVAAALGAVGALLQMLAMGYAAAGATTGLKDGIVRTFVAGGGIALAGGTVAQGALGIAQGALAIQVADYQEEAANRRADSIELDTRTRQIQALIEDCIKYVQGVNQQLESATSITAQCVQEWSASMSRLSLSSHKKAAMA